MQLCRCWHVERSRKPPFFSCNSLWEPHAIQRSDCHLVPHLVCRLELDRASDAELACRSPCVSAPSCSSRLATADANRCSPLMSDETMRYFGGWT